MKRCRFIMFFIVLAAIGGAIWWTVRIRNVTPRLLSVPPQANVVIATVVTNSPRAAVTTTKGDQQATVGIVQDLFSTPISFFGKVQDQSGLPIGGAEVEFGAIDQFWESGSKHHALSGANGLFSITGIKGAGLTVSVSKTGFAGIDGLSYQSFGYGMPPDSTRKAPPSRNAPAIFILRKKAMADALYEVRRDIVIPKNGTPVDVSLRTGKPIDHDKGDIRIECWTSDDVKDAQGHYDWRARFSVPGGGLALRTESELEFTAPESGYEPTLEVAMPHTAQHWRRDSDGQFWVKLGNGTFARVRLRITTAGAHFATINSYLNPSGSRNLEYDENKVPP
jgi:hypothetical protein